MAFVQIIEFRTSKIDEVQRVGDEAAARLGGPQGRVKRVVVCEDRDQKGRYFNIVFFDSYEAAMENSSDPATQELAEKMMALSDGPPTFYNLDVIDEPVAG